MKFHYMLIEIHQNGIRFLYFCPGSINYFTQISH